MTQSEIRAAAERGVPPIVEKCLREIRHIATLPVVTIKMMRLADDVNATAKDFDTVIRNDPALSFRILKVVNSSFYGLPQIASINRAVLLLGFNAVKNIAISASLHKLFRAKNLDPHFDTRDLWMHSVAVATGARALAEKAGFALVDEAFLAGLFHDIGIMIELQACPQKFSEMIKRLSCEPGLTFRQAEEHVLGATHESFGTALCRKWNFPMKLAHVAGYHHEPMQLPESDFVLPAIVYVADVLAARTGLGYTRTVETDTVDQRVINALNLSEADIEAVAETLPNAVQEVQDIFSCE